MRWMAFLKLSAKLRRNAVHFFHLHMPQQSTSTGLGHASVRIVTSYYRRKQYPMCRCQVMGGGQSFCSCGGRVGAGNGNTGHRSTKQHASWALPCPSGFYLGAPGGPWSGGLIRVSWDSQVSCRAGSVARSYKHCRSTGYKELFSVDTDPKARCVYFCQQYPSYSTF